MYKWVDKNGTTSFSDTPPTGRNDVEIFEATPAYIGDGLEKTDNDYRKKNTQKQAPIQQRIKRNKVDLYVTDWCPYCKKAENFFKSRNIKVSIYDIEIDKKAQKRKYKLDNRKGVPFAVINGKKIHGYNENLYREALNL